MRILIVEDERKIAHSIKKGLEQQTFAVDLAFDGKEGYVFATTEDYDLIILDLMLPEIDGLTVCKKLRNAGNQTPILMLTAKSEIEDRVTGLNTGADDYLTKPFAFNELLARVRAISRRPKRNLESILKFEDLSLNPQTFEVKRGENVINLSKKEFALLEFFLKNPNQVLTKEQIINHCWNYDADILDNTVEVYIGYLRKKIDLVFKNKHRLIQTVRGFGYKLSR